MSQPSVTLTPPLIAAEASVRDLLSLLKPRVMTLVVFSGAAGMLLAPGMLHPYLQLLVVCAIALGSGAGGMLNMWYDRDIDAIMKRTQKRPLPQGTVAADDVLVLGLILSFLSVMLLGLATNWVAAGWLAFAIFFYAVIYTMGLKRATPQNIVIGGAAGAFPPVIGWAAVSGNTPLEAWILFAVIFLWTPPHFWALALFRNSDYVSANIPMMPVVRGARHTGRQMMAYSLALALLCLMPVAIGMSGSFYLLASITLNSVFCLLCYRVLADIDNPVPAKRLFGYSILYLFLLFGALLIDRALLS